MKLYGWREPLLGLLKAVLAGQDTEAKTKATGLIDHLGRREYLEFGDILKAQDQIEN